MQVLALYDIHGNPDALEAVLTDPRAVTVDAIVVGGDAVPGPFASAVLDRLDALDVPVHLVRGNGEREVAAEGDATDEPTADDLVSVTAHATMRELGADRARALAAWPATVELDGVVDCHATLARDDEMLTRESPDARWEEAFRDVEAQVVVAGHTHQQLDRRAGHVRYVNAGSVGMPYEGDGRARWALVVDGEPTLYATDYEHRATGERILAAGWPDERSIRASLVDPVDPAEITSFFEAISAEQHHP